ncbi:platelet endothelial aggregation receptor 1, partial [Biomphalaria glabrata]
QPCIIGWFGPKCQYRCNCQTRCNAEGECLGKCKYGWFGYKCQFASNSFNVATNQSHDDILYAVSDDDDETCIDLQTETLALQLGKKYSNPWVRLVTRNLDIIKDLIVSILNYNFEEIDALSFQAFIVRDRTIDIHFEVQDKYVHYIFLESTLLSHICSITISLGQNVALKQDVFYSNSETLLQNSASVFKYSQATDGFDTCIEDSTEYRALHWKIFFQPTFVNKMFIYYTDLFEDAQVNFVVKKYNDYGEIYDKVTTTMEPYRKKIIYVTHKQALAKSFTMTAKNVTTNASLPFLLCELETYSECHAGTWGVHCQNSCNANCPNKCRFDDGLCSDTCYGFSDPPFCNTVCKHGFWGFNCKNACSKQCINSSCDRATGMCHHCIGYIDPLTCTFF